MEKEKLTFNVIDDNGNNIECEILFTFESDETGKNYIVYTDNTTDEHGNTKVYASIFNPNEPDSKLTAIKTEKTILNPLKINFSAMPVFLSQAGQSVPLQFLFY